MIINNYYNENNGFYSEIAGEWVSWDDPQAIAMMMEDNRHRQHREEQAAKVTEETSVKKLEARISELTAAIQQLISVINERG